MWASGVCLTYIYIYLMFMVPYILVIYVKLKVQLDVRFMDSLFLSISNSTCFGCYCTHLQDLQL
jgi:hypothetical protein